MTPPTLRSLNQWIVWRYTGEDRRKVPFDARTWQPASTTDASTWCDFATAESAIAGFSGLGFVFAESDGLFGVDLDGCRDPQSGAVAEWARELITELGTYAEISPSETGVKLYGRGWSGRGRKRQLAECQPVGGKLPAIEVYASGRYFAFTGRAVDGVPNDVTECGAAMRAIYGRFWPEQSAAPMPSTSRPIATNDLQRRAAAYLATVEPAISGQGGHNTTFRAACALVVGFGLSTEDAWPLLVDYNQRCVPPWTERELRHKLAGAEKEPGERGRLAAESNWLQPVDYGVDLSQFMQPGAASVDSTTTADAVEPDATDTPSAAGEFPPDCLKPPGLIADIVDYNLSTALYPQPELALAAAIALVATITGRKLAAPDGCRTNVFVLGLSPTGSGKEHARKINKEILVRAGGEKLVGPERIGSHAGVVAWIGERPTLLFQLDEIGRLLETMKQPGKAAHLFNIATVLMQLYGASDTLFIGDAYADVKKTKTIDQPHAVIYGTSTPAQFWGSLTAENITDGFLGRFMPFESSAGYVMAADPSQAEIPEEIIDAVKWWVSFNPGGNLSAEHPQPVKAKYGAGAGERLREHLRAIGERRQKDSPTAAAIWSRSGGKAAKLALILAASRQAYCGEFRIDRGDVDRAIRLSNWLTRRTLQMVFDHVSENENEAKAKRLLRLIGAPITASQLARQSQWMKARERRELIGDLLEAGFIVAETAETKGRPTTVYRRVN